MKAFTELGLSEKNFTSPEKKRLRRTNKNSRTHNTAIIRK